MNYDISKSHYLRSLAINAVTASMLFDGRTIMNASDAQRVEQIYALLHLESVDPEEHRQGQTAARVQPPQRDDLNGIEAAIAKAVAIGADLPQELADASATRGASGTAF